MPAPLRTFMVLLWVSSIAGAAVVAFLSMGWVTWPAFATAGLLGLVVGVPAGIWTARAVKRDDPNWPPNRVRTRKPDRS